MDRARDAGFSLGSSAELVGCGRLYPRRPYIIRVNTFHVPSVESTLLHSLVSKGKNFVHTAPVVFQDSILGTRRYFELGVHFSPTTTVAAALSGLPHAGDWRLSPESIIWSPVHASVIGERPACDYLLFIALYWRVNGANEIVNAYVDKDIASRFDPTVSKVEEFINRHLPMSMYVDSVENPVKDLCDVSIMTSKKYMLATPGGPTDYLEDRDSIKITKRAIQLCDTPLQVIKKSGILNEYELDDFAYPTMEKAIGAWAGKIVAMSPEEHVRYFVDNDGPECLFDSYYPVVMKTSDECLRHTWYLACLIMINKSWAEVNARAASGDLAEEGAEEEEESVSLDEEDDGVYSDEEDEDDDDDDGEVEIGEEDEEEAIPQKGYRKRVKTLESRPRVNWKHSAPVRHAFYCIMGGFIKLFYHALLANKIDDDSWRPCPDGEPTLLDKYFPHDTACFHAGDLPMLNGVIDQMGLYGVQAVKNKIPIVRMMMKSLPVCCQSRDLVPCFITECQEMKSEGYWRAVRPMFFCTMAGLYPHSEHRLDFRSAMKAYELLYIHPGTFFAALGKESAYFAELKRQNAANGATEKIKLTNKSAQLIYVTFREFLVYSVDTNSEWISVVNQRISWNDFVLHTLSMTDELRKCARFADAPKDDELLFGINALWRHKGTYVSGVYRYRKKEYTPTMIDKMNKVRDDLFRQRQTVEDEMREANAIIDKLIAGRVIDLEDLRPVSATRHVRTLRRDPVTSVMYKSPFVFYKADPAGFLRVMGDVLQDAYNTYANLAYVLDPAIKDNIQRYVCQIHPDKRLEFDNLLDPRLGGVSRGSIQTMAKTRTIYETRSSPKSILLHVQNLPIRDLHVYSWYFNCVARLQKFNLIPLDADTISKQAAAMRRHRYHLLDEEPLPASAWRIYVTLCCGRVATFNNTSIYGTYAIAYDPRTKNMVCSKKVARTTRDRKKGTNAAEPAKPTRDAKGKKARAERNDDNHIACDSQPAIPVDLWGYALEYGGERYMFCPECAQFHVYRTLGWGRRGYMCKSCRDKEPTVNNLRKCAFCKESCPTVVETVPVIAVDADPTNPGHNPYKDPLACFQHVHLCQSDANSAGLYATHYINRFHAFLPKDELWKTIERINPERAIKNYQKYSK